MRGQQRGFTLIELQVSAIIAFIVLTATLALYIFSWQSFTKGNTLLDVYLNSRNASAYLTRDIRFARQIETNYTSAGGVTYTTSDSVIVLKIPSIDNSTPPKDISFNSYYDHIIYELQGSDLYRIVFIDSKFKTVGDPYYNKNGRKDENRIIARYCSSLTFSSGGVNLSGIANLSTVNTVAIYLPINKTNLAFSGLGMGASSINPTTIVKLRNK